MHDSPASSRQIGAMAETLVTQRCAELGLAYQVYPEGQIYDLEINGYKVDVKSAQTARSGYFPFTLTKNQLPVVDFMICYIWPRRTFYVFPNDGRGKYIRDDRDQKHGRHKEAWGVLQKHGGKHDHD